MGRHCFIRPSLSGQMHILFLPSFYPLLSKRQKHQDVKIKSWKKSEQFFDKGGSGISEIRGYIFGYYNEQGLLWLLQRLGVKDAGCPGIPPCSRNQKHCLYPACLSYVRMNRHTNKRKTKTTFIIRWAWKLTPLYIFLQSIFFFYTILISKTITTGL